MWFHPSLTNPYTYAKWPRKKLKRENGEANRKRSLVPKQPYIFLRNPDLEEKILAKSLLNDIVPHLILEVLMSTTTTWRSLPFLFCPLHKGHCKNKVRWHVGKLSNMHEYLWSWSSLGLNHSFLSRSSITLWFLTTWLPSVLSKIGMILPTSEDYFEVISNHNVHEAHDTLAGS